MTAGPGPGSTSRGAVRRRGLAECAVFLGPGLIYLAVFFVIPVALVLGLTIFQRGTYGGVVFEPTLENFGRALDPIYLSVLRDSIIIALTTTALALLVGYPTAWVIALLPRQWRTVALILVVLPFWTNFLIRTYAWILLLNTQGPLNGALVSVGILDEPVQLLYTPAAVVAGLLYAYLPLMILPLYAAIERLDPEMREAAANLGAAPGRVFRTVTLPLTLPGVLIGCIFVFVPSIGNFVIPELLGGGKLVLVGNLVRDQFLKARDWPFGAVLALSVLILLLGLLFAQARVSRRVSAGADA